MELGFYLQNGYKLVSESETTYTLVQKQSVGIHILLFCLTGGIGNIIYFIVKNGKKITVSKKG